MNKNIVYIAAAGSGKTTKLVEVALKKSKTEQVLLLTYTSSNEQEISSIKRMRVFLKMSQFKHGFPFLYNME